MSDEPARFRDSLLWDRLRGFFIWCVAPFIVGGVAGFVGVVLGQLWLR